MSATRNYSVGFDFFNVKISKQMILVDSGFTEGHVYLVLGVLPEQVGCCTYSVQLLWRIRTRYKLLLLFAYHVRFV